MPKALSVVDVVLGEAKAGDYEDMLAVASVVANRARDLGVTPEQVVADAREFNAYGKDLPPGATRNRDLAEAALAEVMTSGPVHSGSFFATPATTRNLPGGLKEVTRTGGHVYYSDPQKRSIRTSVGFRQPMPAEVMGAYNAMPTPSPAVNAINMAAAPGVGLAALASPRTIDLSPPPGATRNQPAQPGIAGIVTNAVSRMSPEYGFGAVSVGQPSTGPNRKGSTRHDHGRAIDGHLTYNGDRVTPGTDRQGYMDLMTNLAEAGAQGIGHYEWGIHADEVSPAAWGHDKTRRTLDPDFGLAIQQGRGLSSLGGAYPTPTPAPRTPQARVNPVDPGAFAASIRSAPAPSLFNTPPAAPSIAGPGLAMGMAPLSMSAGLTPPALAMRAPPATPAPGPVTPSMPPLAPPRTIGPTPGFRAPMAAPVQQRQMTEFERNFTPGLSFPDAPPAPQRSMLGSVMGGLVGGAVAGPVGALGGAYLGSRVAPPTTPSLRAPEDAKRTGQRQRSPGLPAAVMGSLLGGMVAGPIGAVAGAALGSRVGGGQPGLSGMGGGGGLLGALFGGQQPGKPGTLGSGELTSFGRRAAEGGVGGYNSQAGRAARGEISGLF